MKKIIGILTIVVIACTMFLNTNTLNNSKGDMDLAELMAVNIANAEFGSEDGCYDTGNWFSYCSGVTGCMPSSLGSCWYYQSPW